MTRIFINVKFEDSGTCDFKSYFHNNDEIFTLDALKYNLALDLSDYTEDGTDSSSYLRVQFYIAKKSSRDSKITEKWINTIPCSMLLEKLTSPAKIAEMQKSDAWQFF
mmetsp:Transcript_31456/g.39094  ORF Transcript_31456/g.39094 Transcript_31456/m.39094 type:complete len:108 (+) Transcript_31456:197-520(+)|eukprot:CAMPEP_0170457708 /NCGR_PEP_ID=MMETSP0123-20130129/4910_1 /TAXON_ID=182087 /ORGANISM="Favella ehrenbergii, Strain Fehren 1" /LENGTH=107 /DNA_ID=CAMNT_0010721591 /DNA_START=194 /DNA_END=517 /DNA_ORIENTATION=-